LQKIEISLPKSGHLLATCHRDVIKTFRDTINRIDSGEVASPCVLLFRQKEPTRLDHHTWHHELEQKMWLDDLLERIQEFRGLVNQVRKIKMKSVFVIESDCFGSYWDIALACDLRICFNSKLQVGYPEISDGSFPLGGGLESLFLHDPKGIGALESWRRMPVRSVEKAHAEGLVSHLLPARDLEPALAKWMASPSAINAVSDLQLASHQKSEPRIIDLAPEILEDLQARLNRRYGVMSDLPQAWRSCTALLEERIKGVGVVEKATLISYLVSRYMLSAEYLQQLSRKFSTDSEQPPKQARRFKALQVNLGYEVPPSKLMVKLFEAHTEIVFFSDEVVPLKAGLEVAFARLERLVGAKKAAKYWQDWVSLYQGSGHHQRVPKLEFSFDDTLNLAFADTKLSYFRLQGNQSRSGVGWIEILGSAELASHDSSLRQLVEALHEGVIELDRKLPRSFPLTLLVRSMLLQEILEIAAVHPDGLDGVVEALSSLGWGFAGDEIRWERCLLIRQRYEVSLFEELLAMGITLNEEVWNIGPWKEARHTKISLRSNLKRALVSGVYVAQHLSLFLAELVAEIARWGLIKDIKQADLAVAEIVGFPTTWGSPRQFLEHWGRTRAEVFARHHWRKQERGGSL